MKTKLKFEAFSEFIGKPKTELYEHLQKNYAGQLAKESDINKKDVPKDKNWYYVFGSTFCDRDGSSLVPCLRWGGWGFSRSADWLGDDWYSNDRVVLINSEIKLEKKYMKTKTEILKMIKEIPDKEPDYESNDYDLGLKDMKDEIIKIIELNI